MKQQKAGPKVVLDSVFLVAELLSVFPLFFLSLPARHVLAFDPTAVLVAPLPHLLLQYLLVLDVRVGFSSLVAG